MIVGSAIIVGLAMIAGPSYDTPPYAMIATS
jgi:hypothetical protein